MTHGDAFAHNVVDFGVHRNRAECGPPRMPDGYHLDGTGLYVTSTGNPADAARVAGPLTVVAETRRPGGWNWGLLLRWWDRDGAAHETIVRREDLSAGGGSVCRRLAGGGFWIAPRAEARRAVVTFLSAITVPERTTVVSAPGWHADVYVLPDQTLGSEDSERLILDTTGVDLPAIHAAGDFASWRHEVAAPAVGNSRLAVALAAALAPPLLAPLELEGGGLHFRGASSTGKSTLLEAAASVWGSSSFMGSWGATANGLEAVAAGATMGSSSSTSWARSPAGKRARPPTCWPTVRRLRRRRHDRLSIPWSGWAGGHFGRRRCQAESADIGRSGRRPAFDRRTIF